MWFVWVVEWVNEVGEGWRNRRWEERFPDC